MKKQYIYLLFSLGILLFSFTIGMLLGPCSQKTQEVEPINNDPKTEALMLMIEFEGTEGLINFVNDNMHLIFSR